MPTAAVHIEPFPLTKRGNKNHPVKTLQYLLRAHRRSIAVDGIFGPDTEAAVREFQGIRGLAVDGIAGPKTWGKLIITVRKGDRGSAVSGVQEEFEFRNLSGNPGLAVDGIFGPKTDSAVRGFQQALGITVDGIVGPVTWQALVSGMLSG
jgi:peptidoglycan hydrolase-like protein with peptidoglycan-binding domain